MNAKEKITEVAQLMEEFRLDEASIQSEGFKVAFKRNRPQPRTVVTTTSSSEDRQDDQPDDAQEVVPVPAVPLGTPVTSPMNGVFYSTPGPGQNSFIKEGETVIAGQVIGLIEAMKVFNEIPSPATGVIKKIVVENGTVVNPGDVLIILG